MSGVKRLWWMDGQYKMLAFCLVAWNPKVSRINVPLVRPGNDADGVFSIGAAEKVGRKELTMTGSRWDHIKTTPSVGK